MKGIPFYFLLLFVGIFSSIMIANFLKPDIQQNDRTQKINEVVSAQIYNSADLGAIRVNGGIFLDTQDFEQAVRADLIERYKSAKIRFEYLENPNSSLKAIKVFMEYEDLIYTSTQKVNEI
ncbi:hypothetical protein [Lysinibacillus fusiformis]|uniref:hypothetical protein n=1 Tax=Lysinibacillus fusiformis TaxID=28031 RepID=UPI000D37756D|nr:hypothetical protein [Lysinibacillus fusiformis]MED4672375.1 hypothetical protein [Lysinibacillus fusiformis]RDV32230.1 hypothetical protein C7B90_10925 [Lysinibacillus fusiformis]GED65584.1 hypothetical protein LFU01_40360 [Lysinibacillus fusiformis]